MSLLSHPVEACRNRDVTNRLLRTVAPACCFLLLHSAQGVSAQTKVTVRASTQRTIGGVGELDRGRYFNHWGTHVPPTNTNLGNLAEAVWRPDELHSVTGRETFELDYFSRNVPQDPARPGYFQQSGLAAAFQGDYRSWVLSSQRWESLREHPNPAFVQSGRANGAWPSWIKDGTPLPIANNGAAYAEVLNAYLEEVVYGEGPNQGYLPFDKDRHYVEIVNEPQWEGVPWNDVITMHRTVTEMVKEAHPEAKIGGVSCCSGLDVNSLNNWNRMEAIMSDMVDWQTAGGEKAEFDFWTIHPYERYSVLGNGSHVQDVKHSPGHLDSILDLYESRSQQLFNDPKAFAVTEYGSWNRTNLPNQDYGNYSRPEQQWDLVRDIREKLMVFMNRPDRIINATPFVAPQWYTGSTPTDPDGDPVFWEKDASGAWQETIVASMYRLYNDLSGRYVEVGSDNVDLQTHAFRDGDKLYVVLNNLEGTTNSLDLEAITGGATVASASLDRIYWDGTQGVYQSDLDVTANWQSLSLQPEEGAVLTLTLAGPQLYDFATDERTFYGDASLAPIASQGVSQEVNLVADLEDAVSAKVRVSYDRPAQTFGEAFELIVNGTRIDVPAQQNAYDDGDADMVTREVEVPISVLNDGDNEVFVDFFGSGGDLITAVMIVTRSIGDFNDNGAFDGGDLAVLIDQFGTVNAGSKYDLAGVNGVVDMTDVVHWLTELRGASPALVGDFNGDGAVDAADYTVWRDNAQAGEDSSLNGAGDSFDGVDATDLLLWRANFGSRLPPGPVVTVPEPATVWVTLIGFAAAGTRAPRKRCD